MGTLNKAISLYYPDAMNNPSTLFMGTSSVIYVSVPDPTRHFHRGTSAKGSDFLAADGIYLSMRGIIHLYED